ncbi:MAG: hypothetical protein ACJZ14_04305 [Candidatus Neomarinimicrobiota bacterium]
MAKLKELILLDGEEVTFQLEGNAYTESPNPIIKFFGAIIRIFGKIFGWSLKTYIVITNKRIVRIDKEKILWIIPRNLVVLTLPKSSIREVGYAQTIRLIFFKTLYLRLETYTEKTMIAYKGSLKEINDIVNKVAKLITD